VALEFDLRLEERLALIKCDECGNQVSSNAQACPHCGAPIGGSTAPPIGGFRKGITTRPDFWHDPNVGCIGCFVIVLIIAIIIFSSKC